MRFLGNIEAKTDAKGRAFLPASFRKMLSASGEERLIMRMDAFQPCLKLYPESVWDEMLDSLRKKLNRWNKEHQQVLRQFVSEVELVTLDGNGRFLIPKRFLIKAGIDQSIRFIGMDDSIEIWNNNGDESPFMETEDFQRALGEVMKDEPMEL